MIWKGPEKERRKSGVSMLIDKSARCRSPFQFGREVPRSARSLVMASLPKSRG